jgi:hypothetical protein
MHRAVWPCILVVLLGGRAAAQDKPDFSGEWVLVNPGDASAEFDRKLVVRQVVEGVPVRGTTAGSGACRAARELAQDVGETPGPEVPGRGQGSVAPAAVKRITSARRGPPARRLPMTPDSAP